MRGIKFRVWDKHVKKMGKVTEIIFSNVQETLVKYQYINDYGKTIDEQSHIDDKGHGVAKLLQYTGLKDKNGKGIYEGDIVRCYGGAYLNGIYEYDYVIEVKDIRDLNGIIYSENVEILGNKYENQELLEGEK